MIKAKIKSHKEKLRPMQNPLWFMGFKILTLPLKYSFDPTRVWEHPPSVPGGILSPSSMDYGHLLSFLLTPQQVDPVPLG